jgi:hypothetical protein
MLSEVLMKAGTARIERSGALGFIQGIERNIVECIGENNPSRASPVIMPVLLQKNALSPRGKEHGESQRAEL